jgi:hypothetical protein
VLEGQVASLVGGRRADDRDIGLNGRKMQPVVVGKAHAPDDRLGLRCGVHGAAFLLGIDEGVDADLGQHAGGVFAAPSLSMSKTMPEGTFQAATSSFKIICQMSGGFGTARTGRIRTADDLLQHPWPGDVIDPLRPEEISGGDGVNRRQSARMSLRLEPLSECPQNLIRTTQAGRRIDRQHRPIFDQPGGPRVRSSFCPCQGSFSCCVSN